MSKQQRYIDKLIKIYGDKYDLSQTVYDAKQSPVTITCKKHGSFELLACSMLRRTDLEKCSNCRAEQALIKRVAGRYDTSRLHHIDQNTKIELVCYTHGPFWQLPANIGRHGCAKCGRESAISKQQMNFGEFLKRSRDIHGKRYNYDKAKYSNAHQNVIVTCHTHGDFEVTPANHIHNDSGCPSCGRRFSRQEYKISKILESLDIDFIPQKGFDDLKNPKTGQKLYYDFYLPKYNLLVEYDGEHHFRPIRFNGALTKAQVENNFKQIQYRDSVKNAYVGQRIDLELERITFKQNIKQELNNILRKYDQEIDS